MALARAHYGLILGTNSTFRIHLKRGLRPTPKRCCGWMQIALVRLLLDDELKLARLRIQGNVVNRIDDE